MIGRIVHYHSLRRNQLPHSMAWKMSGLWLYSDTVMRWLRFAVVAACCLYLFSEQANSAQASADNRVAAKVAQQAREIDALRKIVAACLSDATGKPLRVGDEWFLCGIASIGTFK